MAKIKICLDPGHYGNYNQSPVNKNYYEAEQMWKLHLLLKKELEAYGITVTTTRSDKNKDLGLTARGQKAKGCDLFLSLHSDAWSDSSIDHPVTIYPVSGKGKDLAEKLTKCVADTIKTKQEGESRSVPGTKGGDWYSVIAGAVSVGVIGIIIEHGFHTNKAVADWLMSESNLAKMAKAEADLIAEHYGLKKQTATTTPATKTETAAKTEKVMYRVQSGAYGVKTNAEARKNALIKAGFNPYLEYENAMYKVAVGAYSVKANAEAQLAKVKAKGFNDAFIATIGEVTASVTKAPVATYTVKDFTKEVQAAIGAKVDGVAGTETKSKLVTVSATINNRHKVVKAIQKRLNALGFDCGTVDGIAGTKFTAALKAYQKAKGLDPDGVCGIKTYTKLLEIG